MANKKTLFHIGRPWPTIGNTNDTFDVGILNNATSKTEVLDLPKTKGSLAVTIEEVLYAVSKGNAEVVSITGDVLNQTDLYQNLCHQQIPLYHSELSQTCSTRKEWFNRNNQINEFENPPISLTELVPSSLRDQAKFTKKYYLAVAHSILSAYLYYSFSQRLPTQMKLDSQIPQQDSHSHDQLSQLEREEEMQMKNVSSPQNISLLASPQRSIFELFPLYGGAQSYTVYSHLRSNDLVVHRYQRFTSLYWLTGLFTQIPALIYETKNCSPELQRVKVAVIDTKKSKRALYKPISSSNTVLMQQRWASVLKKRDGVSVNVDKIDIQTDTYGKESLIFRKRRAYPNIFDESIPSQSPSRQGLESTLFHSSQCRNYDLYDMKSKKPSGFGLSGSPLRGSNLFGNGIDREQSFEALSSCPIFNAIVDESYEVLELLEHIRADLFFTWQSSQYEAKEAAFSQLFVQREGNQKDEVSYVQSLASNSMSRKKNAKMDLSPSWFRPPPTGAVFSLPHENMERLSTPLPSTSLFCHLSFVEIIRKIQSHLSRLGITMTIAQVSQCRPQYVEITSPFVALVDDIEHLSVATSSEQTIPTSRCCELCIFRLTNPWAKKDDETSRQQHNALNNIHITAQKKNINNVKSII